MICVTLEEDQSLRMRNKRRNLSIIITFAIITFSILLKYTRLYTCPVDKYYVLPKGISSFYFYVYLLFHS